MLARQQWYLDLDWPKGTDQARRASGTRICNLDYRFSCEDESNPKKYAQRSAFAPLACLPLLPLASAAGSGQPLFNFIIQKVPDIQRKNLRCKRFYSAKGATWRTLSYLTFLKTCHWKHLRTSWATPHLLFFEWKESAHLLFFEWKEISAFYDHFSNESLNFREERCNSPFVFCSGRATQRVFRVKKWGAWLEFGCFGGFSLCLCARYGRLVVYLVCLLEVPVKSWKNAA